jgi:parallel beta-helix repeat protein
MIRLIIVTILCLSLSYAENLLVPSDKYVSITSAIDSAAQGDTIRVLPGIYEENINFSGKKIFLTSNYYSSTDKSDIENTIIDGASLSTVVQFENGEDSTSVLNGFTIRDGYNYPGAGGGISCINESSPKLTNLIITENTSANGGGIFCFDSSYPILRNVVISENGAVNSGGGILLDRHCSVRMEDVTISGNVANQDGGGIFVKDSSAIIIYRGKINGNVGDWSGGAIFATQNSTVDLSETEIVDNYTTGSGGGINILESELYLFRTVIAGNNAYDAAAFSASNNSNVYILNTTISSNLVLPSNGPVEIGGIWVDNSTLEFANSIMWDNTGLEIFVTNSNIAMAYSNIEGDSSQIGKDQDSRLFWLEGNISESPIFADSGFYDFRLTGESPCIDAGIDDKILIYNNQQDTLYIPELNFVGMNPDMGAFESGDPTRIVASRITARSYQLHQNYPNPFNPITTIGFTIPKRQHILLEVFNVLGQPVTTLVNEYMEAGYHEVLFSGDELASGVYYYRISAGKFINVKKMLLVR